MKLSLLQLCIKILMNKEVLVHLPYRMWRLRLKGKKNVSTKMLHRSIQAQENERKRISRELHDSVIQDMLNIDVELRLLKYKHRDKVLAETSQRIEGLLSQLIDDIRNMSVELRPSSLDDLGIEAAFKSYFKQFEENYGMHIKYDSNIKGMRFDNEIETVVYRVVQEGVFNALKYAEVNEIGGKYA